LADAAIETPLDPTASVATAPSSTAGTSSSAAADPTQDPTLTSGRVNATTPPPEPLKESVQIVQEVKATAPGKTTAVEPLPAAPAVKIAAAPVKPTVPKTPAPKTAAPKTAAPKTPKPAAASESGEGFVVQVAAVKERSEADTIAKRLSSKGFPSFVSSPSAGAARVYRVRVGKYRERSDAETVARRLEKEEQFKPWITR
jgi:rare lipoprotein A